jgi:hypothetical protein
MKRLSITFFILALLGLALAGCGSPTKTSMTAQSTATPATPEPDYASAITDTTLKGLSDDNLEEYTRYGNAQFKAAVTQQILDTTSAQITNQLGTYESKVYLSTETQDSYTVVHYKAKYTKGEVGVRMVFDKDHLVAGQWFE